MVIEQVFFTLCEIYALAKLSKSWKYKTNFSFENGQKKLKSLWLSLREGPGTREEDWYNNFVRIDA